MSSEGVDLSGVVALGAGGSVLPRLPGVLTMPILCCCRVSSSGLSIWILRRQQLAPVGREMTPMRTPLEKPLLPLGAPRAAECRRARALLSLEAASRHSKQLSLLHDDSAIQSCLTSQIFSSLLQNWENTVPSALTALVDQVSKL